MSGEAGTSLKLDTSKFDFKSRALIRRHSIEKMVKECCARLKQNEDVSKMNRKLVWHNVIFSVLFFTKINHPLPYLFIHITIN